MFECKSLSDITSMFEARASDERRKMESLAVSQKAKNDYKARMQTWTEAANIMKNTHLVIGEPLNNK